ncbi:hypothetical protein [Eikenella halliae]|uniref:hypothetical protein n=1 Tax=Eikenella halliae TaxID=1795832 RepID=UPI003614A817
MHVTFPEWFDDLAEFEAESKGCLLDFPLHINGQDFVFTFYDLCRLNQTRTDESAAAGFLENEAVVVLQAVNRKNIARFAQTIFR